MHFYLFPLVVCFFIFICRFSKTEKDDGSGGTYVVDCVSETKWEIAHPRDLSQAKCLPGNNIGPTTDVPKQRVL